MDKFLKCLQEVEKYIVDQKQKCVVLLEVGNLIDTIYASIALRWYKRQEYHTILIIDKEHIGIHESSADKIFSFKVDFKFKFLYRKELAKRTFTWLAPHPYYTREFPDLILRTPIVLDQYLLNAKVSPNICKTPKCLISEDDILFAKDFAAAKHINLSRAVALDISTISLQEIIYLIRTLQLGVVDFNDKGYQGAADGTILSYKQRIALLNNIPMIIGQAGDMSILSLACQHPPKIVEIGVDKFSSIQTIFRHECFGINKGTDAEILANLRPIIKDVYK